MPRSPTTESCPCGNPRPFDDCCGPLLKQRTRATTAEALMRSRYTAFALGDCDYLVATQHPDYRDPQLLSQLRLQDQRCRWLRLEVLDCEAGEAGDREGRVHFRAHCLEQGSVTELAERSNFKYRNGQWFYTDGEPHFKALGKPGRNDPCPCGSGKKYKRCHQDG